MSNREFRFAFDEENNEVRVFEYDEAKVLVTQSALE